MDCPHGFTINDPTWWEKVTLEHDVAVCACCSAPSPSGEVYPGAPLCKRCRNVEMEQLLFLQGHSGVDESVEVDVRS